MIVPKICSYFIQNYLFLLPVTFFILYIYQKRWRKESALHEPFMYQNFKLLKNCKLMTKSTFLKPSKDNYHLQANKINNFVRILSIYLSLCLSLQYNIIYLPSKIQQMFIIDNVALLSIKLKKYFLAFPCQVLLLHFPNMSFSLKD